MPILIANFFIVLISILVFTAPFFIWYSLEHKQTLTYKNFNFYLENFFSSRQSNWLIFAWATCEAIFWFVIPEFLLLLVVFMRIRRKRQMLLYDISGTLFGTTLALLIRLPIKVVDKLPYIQTKMINQTMTWYSQKGILALVHQPFSGIPYKVFTNLAWHYSFSLILFIVFAVIVRIFRYAVAYAIFLSLYPKLHKLVRNNYAPLALAAILIFSILLFKTYSLYR